MKTKMILVFIFTTIAVTSRAANEMTFIGNKSSVRIAPDIISKIFQKMKTLDRHRFKTVEAVETLLPKLHRSIRELIVNGDQEVHRFSLYVQISEESQAGTLPANTAKALKHYFEATHNALQKQFDASTSGRPLSDSEARSSAAYQSGIVLMDVSTPQYPGVYRLDVAYTPEELLVLAARLQSGNPAGDGNVLTFIGADRPRRAGDRVDFVLAAQTISLIVRDRPVSPIVRPPTTGSIIGTHTHR